jgi:opacity protein-like surface antigen
MPTRLCTAVAAALLALSLVPGAAAQERPIRFGIQGNWADDADLGVGARVQVGLADFYEGLRGIASFDYFFPGDDDDIGVVDLDVTYWELNANVTYTLKGRLAPYVGTGLNIAHASAGVDVGDIDLGSDSETDLGLNVLGGLRLSDRFFAEAKLELGGGEQFMLTAGVLF